ncbi:hypothetical protein PCANC_18931 [Puccinia coronata f. sp. avenae]|uniref:Uncharacterized protein n=1 Tax=Puccinia coronata f. sp. avenae TaxID=200324 RepID=A0A2N5U390_9BASI|nr:hypothetical protein PCANC_18931 [Puccinia coronata f. sp. avenae]
MTGSEETGSSVVKLNPSMTTSLSVSVSLTSSFHPALAFHSTDQTVAYSRRTNERFTTLLSVRTASTLIYYIVGVFRGPPSSIKLEFGLVL